MLGRLSRRGADANGLWRGARAALGVVRHAWELDLGFGGPARVEEDGELRVAADATLYYRADLRAALRRAGVEPRSASAAHLIAAAYRAWGGRCVEHLEGDFAFVVWDAAAGEAFAARDFNGTRPLYYALVDGEAVLASTIGAVLAHPACPAELNPAEIAAGAAGFFAAPETCYRAVRVLPAGCRLRWRRGSTQVERFWDPRRSKEDRQPFTEAAEQLRSLLCEAVATRLDGSRPTSVWLSGGYDSTAIFGAGEAVLRGREAGTHLHAVSISYPPGDPGREDELITAVVRHWRSPVHWREIGEIPLIDRPRARASQRDEPFAHAFELWNRALVAGSAAAGCRVAFAGAGGDPIFAATGLYLADLLAAGRWLALVRECRAWRRRGADRRTLLRWAVRPLLPPMLLEHWARLRGVPPPLRPFERAVPDWIDARFAADHRLAERERAHAPQRAGRSFLELETYWYLTHPFTARIGSSVAGFALEGGVEMRLPLCDRRIVEFMLARPWTDRIRLCETKRLLRAAMRGLLPDEVLAPRARRTGVTSGYFRRSMREVYAALLGECFHDPVLAQLGIVDPRRLRERAADYVERNDVRFEVPLFLTLQTELWLQARARPGRFAAAEAASGFVEGSPEAEDSSRPTGRSLAGAQG